MKNFFITLFFSIASFAFAEFDFGHKVQSFILEEKQIKIPGYPDAFNPSIVRWHDGRLLLAFRTRDHLTNNPRLIGFVWLDEEFRPVGNATILAINNVPALKHPREQDPKILKVGDLYYIVYNNTYTDDDIEARRMVVGQLHYSGESFYITSPQTLLKFKGVEKNNWREKGWTPFDYNGSLFLSYSLNPHRVFYPHLDDECCETLAVTSASLNWNWGELRGGTPSLHCGDHYLGFFHSYVNISSIQSKNEKMSHYFMGAYTFADEFPFALTRISSEPLIGETFYHSPDYPTWKPLKVIFPGGFVFDDHFIWVVYGKQDYEAWVVKMDKKALLNSLVPVLQNNTSF